MTLFEILLLIGAGLLGGAGNAIAGGGTFFTFPALLEVGLPPVTANASSAVALWPGRVPSVFVGWKDAMKLKHRLVRSLTIAFVGSAVGAWLLLTTRSETFAALVPWLLLLATLLFVYGNRLVPLFRRFKPRNGGRGLTLIVASVFEFVVAIYGGYFAAGATFMVMACNTLTGIDDVHQNVALKNLQITLMTTVSVAVFIAAGAVAWHHTLIMTVGAFVGGYAGAYIVQMLNARVLRTSITIIAVSLTIYYFVKHYAL